MSQTLLVLAAFIIALGIGIFIGKILFSAKSQSEKSGLEERINGLLGQIEQLKIQFQTERNQFEKSLAQLSSEKENLQKETPRESNTSFPTPKKEKISDSQRLEVQEDISEVQNIVNQSITNSTTENKIKRIVFFYENGKFEAFEP